MNAAAWVEELKSIDGLKSLWVHHGPRLVSGLLMAALAIELAMVVTSQPGTAPPADASPAPAASMPLPAANPTLELATIMNAHLFGQASAELVNAADAPQTNVPLVLSGTLANSDPLKGMAILGPNAATAKLYSTGSVVPGGVKLHSVYGDRVLLDRSGSIEALFLPKTAGPVPVAQAPVPPPPGQRLQSLAQTNSTLLGGLIRFQATLERGKLAGYRIFPGTRSSTAAFNQLGLRAGDLVTAINGTALDDPNRGQEILQTLSSASSATVTVTRNGQPQEVNLNLETVAQQAEAAAAEPAEERRGRSGGANGPPGLGGRRAPGEIAAPAPEANPVETNPAER